MINLKDERRNKAQTREDKQAQNNLVKINLMYKSGSYNKRKWT